MDLNPTPTRQIVPDVSNDVFGYFHRTYHIQNSDGSVDQDTLDMNGVLDEAKIEEIHGRICERCHIAFPSPHSPSKLQSSVGIYKWKGSFLSDVFFDLWKRYPYRHREDSCLLATRIPNEFLILKIQKESNRYIASKKFHLVRGESDVHVAYYHAYDQFCSRCF